ERIVDPAAADWRWRQALLGIVAMRRVDIVDHQVERRAPPGLRWLLGVSDDDMRAAAQLKHSKLRHRDDRAPPGRLEPARRSADIDDREAHMTDRDRRPLIVRMGIHGTGHSLPPRSSS